MLKVTGIAFSCCAVTDIGASKVANVLKKDKVIP
jgi:hypothetical protein